MASLITLMAEICEPIWKCNNCKELSKSASRNLSTAWMISGIVKPNLARSPVDVPQRPIPWVLNLARTPKIGLIPN